MNAQWFGRPALFWVTVVAVGLMVIGGFGPWVSILGLATVAGTHGDGWVLIIGGAAAAGLLARQLRGDGRHWPMIVTVVIALIGAAVAISDLSDLSSTADGTFLDGAVSAGWGLYACLIGSLALGVAAVLALVSKPYARAAVLAAPAAPGETVG
jgi:hypothetical protein